MSDDADETEALRETLAALEMPPGGLAQWFERSRAFCMRHGGERRYPELLALFRECESLLTDEK